MCWGGCGNIGILVHYWWEHKIVQPLWKTVWWFLKKSEIDLLYYPAIPLLGVCPKELKAGTQTHISMFTTALFTIAKCPGTDEWISKMWYIYAMEYFFLGIF